jgi:hypothetical protein
MVRTLTTGPDGSCIAAEETRQQTQSAPLIEGHNSSKAGSSKVSAGEKRQLRKPEPNQPDRAKHWFDAPSAEQLLESEAAVVT